MLRISSLQSIRLNKAKTGDFFLPREQSSEKFIVGLVNTQFPVGLQLDGDKPFWFSDLPVLDGRRGYTVSQCEYFVDPDSSMAWRGAEDTNVSHGALVLGGEQMAIVGHGRNVSKALVSLQDMNVSDEDADAIAFTRWTVATASGSGAWHQLFRFDGGLEGRPGSL